MHFACSVHPRLRGTGVACEQALKLNWEPASVTNEFEYISFFQIWNVYPYMVLFTTSVQTKFRPCKLNLDRTVYTVFRNIRYLSKSLNVLNTVFSKQNISCFEIRRPIPIWSVKCFLCIVLQQLTYIELSGNI
jgi:hypothetical protein